MIGGVVIRMALIRQRRSLAWGVLYDTRRYQEVLKAKKKHCFSFFPNTYRLGVKSQQKQTLLTVN